MYFRAHAEFSTSKFPHGRLILTTTSVNKIRNFYSAAAECRLPITNHDVFPLPFPSEMADIPPAPPSQCQAAILVRRRNTRWRRCSPRGLSFPATTHFRSRIILSTNRRRRNGECWCVTSAVLFPLLMCPPDSPGGGRVGCSKPKTEKSTLATVKLRWKCRRCKSPKFTIYSSLSLDYVPWHSIRKCSRPFFYAG